MKDIFISVKKAGTPLVCLEVADQYEAVRNLVPVIKDPQYNFSEGPVFEWTCNGGLLPLNKMAMQIAPTIYGELDPAQATNNPSEMLYLLKKLSVENMTVFMHDAHEAVQEYTAYTGALNLRDIWKSKRCQLIMMAPMWTPKPELASSVTVIKEDVLTDDQVRKIITDVMAGQETPFKELDMDRIVDTLVSLPCAYAVEEAFSQCVCRTPDGKMLDVDMRMLKTQSNNSTEMVDGLKVGKAVSPEFLGGNEFFKSFMYRIKNGPKKFNTVVFIDEGEKFLGRAEGDSSGTKMDQLSVMLKEMVDNRYNGIILVGVPGAGKTFASAVAASILGADFLEFDGGAMQDKFVGESGRKTRLVFKTIKARSRGKALFIMTCNDISSLKPELKRRFPWIFFADIPTAEEKEKIWKIQIKMWNLRKDQITPVNDENWTGADIRNCCENAWMMDCTLAEAQDVVVPVMTQAPLVIKNLREEANEKYLSMSHPGPYKSQIQAWNGDPVVRKLG